MPSPFGLPIGNIVDVVRHWTSDDDGYERFRNEAARLAERIRSTVAQARKQAPYLNFAFPANGWGGKSRCRNAILQALFGSSCSDPWTVFTCDLGIGVIDHHHEVHLYKWEDVKKVKTNFTDASMVRVIIRKCRHLDLRFGAKFAGINPQRLLREERIEWECRPSSQAQVSE